MPNLASSVGASGEASAGCYLGSKLWAIGMIAFEALCWSKGSEENSSSQTGIGENGSMLLALLNILKTLPHWSLLVLDGS